MKREIDYSYSTTFCDLVISKGNNIPRSITYFSCTLLLGLLSFIFPAILGELNACTDSK